MESTSKCFTEIKYNTLMIVFLNYEKPFIQVAAIASLRRVDRNVGATKAKEMRYL